MAVASTAARRICSHSALRCVAITGGTHGNEATGTSLAKYLMGAGAESTRRPSFETLVMLTNTASMGTNTRYVETDMNRCFFVEDLADPSLTLIEQRRAKEIDKELGPKASADPRCDFIFDLHTTSANTGIALMMAPDDDFAHEVGMHLMAIDETVRIVEWAEQPAWPMLPTIGRSGMTFEVGPCSWGCVVAELHERSRVLLLAALDFIEAHNQAITSSKRRRTGEGGGEGGGAAAGMIEGSMRVPVFQRAVTVDYPRAAVREGGGEAKGEIAAMVHPALQGGDFEALHEGDPLFMNLDGSTEKFTRAKYCADALSSGAITPEEVLYPFFINEAAYYEKGIAFMLAKKVQRTISVYSTGSKI